MNFFFLEWKLNEIGRFFGYNNFYINFKIGLRVHDVFRGQKKFEKNLFEIKVVNTKLKIKTKK